MYIYICIYIYNYVYIYVLGERYLYLRPDFLHAKLGFSLFAFVFYALLVPWNSERLLL